MASQDSCCTDVPHIKVNNGRLDAFKTLCECLVPQSDSELNPLLYEHNMAFGTRGCG